MGKSTTKAADKSKPRAALSITSKRDTFGRCGYRFLRNEPTLIALDELEPDEIERLRSEPELVVHDDEIPAEVATGNAA